MATYSEINDRIFKMLDELDADPSETTLEKGKLVNQLLTTAVNANNSAINAARMQEDTMDGLALKVGTARVLLGQPTVVATLPEPEFDAIEWVRANAAGMSIAVIRNRLNKASGASYSFDEVRAICEEAHVEPKCIGERMDMAQAESDSYGLRGPAKGYSR